MKTKEKAISGSPIMTVPVSGSNVPMPRSDPGKFRELDDNMKIKTIDPQDSSQKPLTSPDQAFSANYDREHVPIDRTTQNAMRSQMMGVDRQQKGLIGDRLNKGFSD